MRKLYIAPITETVEIETEQLLSASGGEKDLNDDTQFNGPLNAPKKEFSSMWYDEE